MPKRTAFASGPRSNDSLNVSLAKLAVGVGAVSIIGGSQQSTAPFQVEIAFSFPAEPVEILPEPKDKFPPTIRPVLDDSENGPFRDSMKTAFANCPKLNRKMAGLMNLHYRTLRDEGLTNNAALAFTLHMVKESTGGLRLNERKGGGPGDGAGSIQFSQWHGSGTGRELTWFKNPDTGKPWAREDVMAIEEGGRVSREQAVINSAKAIAVLLRNVPHYEQLKDASTNPDEAFSSIAMKITKNFVRQSEANKLRAGWIIQTYTMNQDAIEQNIGLMPAATPPVPPPARKMS